MLSSIFRSLSAKNYKIQVIFIYRYNKNSSIPLINSEPKTNNNNIHKNKDQQIRWSDEYWQYTLDANIKEYHIISKSFKSNIREF